MHQCNTVFASVEIFEGANKILEEIEKDGNRQKCKKLVG